ncbi:hypothetical protein HAX54_010766 [Datura stramonium]|uniref:Secreted protein n=1 Tax=Datura stramonium TaxID=4076 RepID=A0ABS8RLS8_DATST|nr:hypothetical protein [Datura stramonium]
MGWNLRFNPQKFCLGPLLRVAVLKAPSLLRIVSLASSPSLRIAAFIAWAGLHIAPGRAMLMHAPYDRPYAAWPDSLVGTRTGPVHRVALVLIRAWHCTEGCRVVLLVERHGLHLTPLVALLVTQAWQCSAKCHDFDLFILTSSP